ncbi:MAG: lipoyl(octanoyl) transferase LipB [Lautropia sp.]|nr:lipoyl(octanoyl) transferase LipB [Lautropia sp.]
MSDPLPSGIRLRLLGTVPYEEALVRMRQWTAARHEAHKAKLAAQRHEDVPSSGRPDHDAAASPLAATAAIQAGGSTSDGENTIGRTTPLVDQAPVLRNWADPADAPTLGDEIWLLQHPPVFTLGLNARTEHLHDAGDIPVVPTERGGQITYHGPGQIMAYLMLDLRRRKLGIRPLVERVETAIIQCLAAYGIDAIRQDGAPGIYVRQGQVPMAEGPTTANTSPARPTGIPSATSRRLAATRPADDVAKIASIGLKATHGFSYHGLALNGQMDLSPFLRINPCGYQHLAMTDVFHETGKHADIDLDALALNLGRALQAAIEGTEG